MVFWVICGYYYDIIVFKDAFHPTFTIIRALYQNLFFKKSNPSGVEMDYFWKQVTEYP